MNWEWYKIRHSHNFRRGFFDILLSSGYGHFACCFILGIWNAEQSLQEMEVESDGKI